MIDHATSRSRAAVDAGWMLAGTAAAALSQFLIVLVLARASGPTSVGLYALGLAIATPVSMLTALGLRTVLVTDPHGLADFARYRRLRLVSAATAFAVTAAIGWLIGGPASPVIALVGAAKAIDSIADIHIGLFQRAGLMRLAGRALVVNAVATTFLVLGMSMVTPDAAVVAFGSALGSLVALLVYCLPHAENVAGGTPPAEWFFERPSLAGLAKIALPMGLATSIAAIAVNVPRWIVASQLDLAALGVFTAIGYVMVTATLVASAGAQTLLPMMSRMFQSGQSRRLIGLTMSLSAVSLGVAAVGMVVCAVQGGYLLEVLYGPGYGRYTTALLIVVAAAGVSGAVFCIGTALSSTRRFKSQLAASVTTLSVTAVLAVVLVPHGITPAMWTLLLPWIVDGTVKTLLLRKAVRHQPLRIAPPVAA